MQLIDLVETSAAVAATRSRLKKASALGDLLGRLAESEVTTAVAWLSGQLPQGRIGIGYAAAKKARPDAPAAEPGLTLAEVDEVFTQIAGTAGPGSARRRHELLHALLARATEAEQSFLFRLVLGELRQGALEGVMADALARATGLDAAALRRAIMLAGDVAEVARAALTEGEPALARFVLELFRPLQPMLAQTAADPSEALERLGRAAFEDKLDGARIQVHKDGGTVRVFSRRGRDVTPAVPEVVELISGLDVRTAVLDGEVLALGEGGRPHPFQVTMRRFGRKLDVEAMRRKLPLTPFFFDCLERGGDELLDRPGAERVQALHELLSPAGCVRRLETDDAETARRFLEESLARGHEGVMAKSLDAPYEAGQRGAAWLKLKPAHTLDLVVLAVEWGSGRRRGFLSNIHLGARDPQAGAFVMLGKTFKGMTDEMLAWQTKELLALETSRDGHVVRVRPELVVEIAFNEIQASSSYPGGMALRFARVKGYRPDKSAADADTLDTVRAIFEGRLPPSLR